VSAFDPSRLAALRARAERDARGQYVVEGVRFAVAAFDAGADIAGVVTARESLRSPVGQIIARRLRQRGTPETRTTADALATLVTSRDAQGIALVVRQLRAPLAAEPARPDALLAVVESVRSPGNLGTIVRTAVAAGADALVCVAHDDGTPAPDPFDPAAVRASMGAITGLRVLDATATELTAWCARSRTRLIVASPGARTDFRAATYRGPTAIVVGSERKGASPALLSAADTRVRIPMVTRMDSLNVAIAAGLLLYEAHRQRFPCATHAGRRVP
jgi:TrmH family RNA methyltransferase